jgi:hypothetical protein
LVMEIIKAYTKYEERLNAVKEEKRK